MTDEAQVPSRYSSPDPPHRSPCSHPSASTQRNISSINRWVWIMLLILPTKNTSFQSQEPDLDLKAHLYFWHVAPESEIPELYNKHKQKRQLCHHKWRDTVAMARNDCFRRHFPQFLKHLYNRNGSRGCFLCIGCNRRAGGAALHARVTARKQPSNRCFWGGALKGEKIAFVTNRDRKRTEVASGAAITFIRRN